MQYDNLARTTAASAAEGRLKPDFGNKKKMKRKMIMDGIGGCKKKK